MQIFKNIEKGNDSEYIKENNEKVKLYYDEAELNPNDFNIFFINDNFDLENDLKLGSKSLSLKYLETKLEEIEKNDLYNTIKQLLTDFSRENLDPYSIKIGDTNIKYNITNFETKQLLKLINPSIYANDLEKNVYDLEYEDVILFQLKLLNKISKISNKKIIIIVDNYMTKQILDELEKINREEVFILILRNINLQHFKTDDYLLVNQTTLDLDNKEKINEFIFNNLPFHVDNVEELFKDYINGKTSNNIIELYKQL